MAAKPFVSDICTSLEASVASGLTALDAFAAAMPLWGYNASLPSQDQCIGAWVGVVVVLFAVVVSYFLYFPTNSSVSSASNPIACTYCFYPPVQSGEYYLHYPLLTAASSFQDDYVAYVGNENFSSPNCNLSCASSRQWIYQSCNEFGYFQTTVSSSVNASSNPFSAFAALNIANAGMSVYAF